MIGNDIVDLAHAQTESNWRRKGYLEKIFTPHEQQLIHNGAHPGPVVWLLWSMKESAYKAAVRERGNRRFAPAKLACDFIYLEKEYAEGIVFYEEKEYLTQSSRNGQYVATVSTNKCIKPNVKPCRTGVSLVHPGSSYPPERQRQAGCLYNKPAPPGQGRLFCLSPPYSSHNLQFDQIIVPLDETDYPQQHTTLWEKVKQHCAAALAVPEEEIRFHKDKTGAPWLTLPSGERMPVSASHHGQFGAFVF